MIDGPEPLRFHCLWKAAICFVSSGVSISSLWSVRLPVGIGSRILNSWAPWSLANSANRSMVPFWSLSRVATVEMAVYRPAARDRRIALVAVLKLPGTALVWSCCWGLSDSMPIVMQSREALESWFASSGVRLWPVVNIMLAVSVPTDSTSWTMSSLRRGSPPVKPMVIVPMDLICSISSIAFSVLRFPLMCLP